MYWFVLVLISIGILIYKNVYDFNYWKKRGVPYVEPIVPFVGNFLETIILRTTLGVLLKKFYDQNATPFFGIYVFHKPCLVVRSTDLIQSVLVNDFDYFCDRNLLSDEKCDSMASKMLGFIKSPEWKPLRFKMSKVFTIGKIRKMWSLITDIAEDANGYLNKHCDKESIDTKEFCAKYTTDIISSYALGINAGSFESDNAPMRVMARKMFGFSVKSGIRQICYFVVPSIVKFFRLRFIDAEITDFLREVFWKIIHQREEYKICRTDLIDALIQLRMEDEVLRKKFEGDVVVAQPLQVFGAGFETTSTAMSFALYELTLQPEIQNKLRREIHKVLSQYGELSYEAVHDMVYLDTIIMETLRKYPTISFIDRVCVKDYKIPNSDVVIEKNTAVLIPTYGIHHDPNYYPNPEKFDPDRFSAENKPLIKNYTYLSFGDGPRGCIGERLGFLLVKVGIGSIISQYELEPCAGTPQRLQFDSKSFILNTAGELPLKFKKIKSPIT